MPAPRHPIPALEPASARRLIASLADLPAGDPLADCLAQADAWEVKATARHQDLIKRRNAGAHNLKRSVAIWDDTMLAFRTALEAARNRQHGKSALPDAAAPTAGDCPAEPDGEVAVARAEPAADGKAKLSGLDAAAQVLREAEESLDAQTMIARILERGLWSTKGKTPAATIYAAIIREIRTKGSASRFKKTDRGRFAAT